MEKDVSAASHGRNGGPEGDGPHSQGTGKRGYRRWTEEDAKRWKECFESGKSILEVAAADEVDPKIVSQWLHRLGVEVYQGRHRVERLPLKIPRELAELLSHGPDHVLKFLDERVWGLTATESGAEQLRKFCKFVELHKQGTGVLDIASQLQVHRTTVSHWRESTDQPYLVRAAQAALQNTPSDEKLLPLRLDSGGNEQSDWIQVPIRVSNYSDIEKVVGQLTPLSQVFELGAQLGLSESQVQSMRLELFAYLLGMMVGDLGKSGGQQKRFASTHIDLQLSQKHESNYRFGTFVCLAASTLGIKMHRIHDKEPTGTTRLAQNPTSAYRWMSKRSPLFAWMFSACLGLQWTQLTSYNPVQMQWILGTSRAFRKRFVQAVADSDARVNSYVVEVVSLPNAEFFAQLLHTLDMPSARTRAENGEELRTIIRAKEAAELPIFNEITKGYRYELLMKYKQD
jgi:hypothetical protein